MANKDDLWAEIVRTKYKCGHDHIPITDPNLPGSNFWKGICHSWKGVESKLIWRVGLGTQVNVCEHRWILGGNKLEELTLRPLAEEEKSLRVCDISSPSEGWDLGKIAHIIPLEVGDRIVQLQAPSQRGNVDFVAWYLTGDGRYSNKPAYESLLVPTNGANQRLFKNIWHWQGIERGRVHLWKCTHKALITISL